jgi:hypothetical protein
MRPKPLVIAVGVAVEVKASDVSPVPGSNRHEQRRVKPALYRVLVGSLSSPAQACRHG